MRIATLAAIRRSLPVFAVLTGMASACGGTVSVTIGGAGDQAASKPDGAFPSAAEINRLPGAPGRFVRLPRLPSSVVNPDPRGPCGTELDQPAFTQKDAALYTSGSDAEVFLWSHRLAPGRALQLIDAVSADIRPGCATFTSKTPYAYDQLNDFLGSIPLPELGDQRVAVASRGRQNHPGQPWVYASEAFVRRGDNLTAIMVLTTAPQPDAFVRGVAVLAAHTAADPPSAP